MLPEERVVAFASWARPPIGLEVRVNFGLFAGREATQAEVDELGRRLLNDVAVVSIVAERRYEVSPQVEASVHQVRIEVEPDRLPDDPGELEQLETRLVATAERWADACVAERSAYSSGA
jgi:hypothetical protein